MRELKAKPGRELQVHGSGDLLRWLLERDLVDELNLRIYPVVVGDGLRLFPERGQTHDLELVESRSTPSGVMLQTYRPAGPRDVRQRRLSDTGPLRLIVREDFAVLYVGQRFGDLVGVDGGNELGQPAGERRDLSATEERPQGVGIGEAEDQ